MSAPILNWIPMVDAKGELQEARLGQCTFTLRKTKRGYSLHGRGVLPPDGGFDIKAGGAEMAMKQHAETLASAYVKVTGMPLNSSEWLAKYSGSMKVLVNGLPGLERGTTAGKPYECEGKHLIGVRREIKGPNISTEVYPIFLEHITVLAPNQ